MRVANTTLTLVIALPLSVAVTAAQGTYTITDLGTRAPYAINANGHVVGIQPSGCFIYDGQDFKNFSAPDTISTTCVSINDSDVAAGTLLRVGPARGFTYDAVHGFTEIGTLGGGFSSATAVNNDAIVVGTSTIAGNPPDNDNLERAFSFKNGKITSLSGLSAAPSQAAGINSSGQIAGMAWISGTLRGFIFDAGNITEISIPFGFTNLSVRGFSDSGHVIGGLYSAGVPRAFLYYAGTTTVIPSMSDGQSSEAHGVNKQGDVVGAGGTSNGLGHAFIFTGGKATDLNTLIGADASADWVLEDATGINGNGVIVGNGSLRGHSRGFLLTPGPPLQVTPKPTITEVVSSGDFISPVALQGFGSVFGTRLSDATVQADTIPLPRKLGNTELFLCLPQAAVDVSRCTATELSYVGPTQINFRVPDELTAAGTYGAVVRTNSLLDADSAIGYPRTVRVLEVAPTIFWMGYDCFTDPRFPDANKNCGLTVIRGATYQAIRGAVTDQQGRLLTSSNPAEFGQYYTLWMTGLGVFTNGNPRTSFSMALTNIPTYAAGGRLFPGDGFPEFLSPSYIGQSAVYPGLYQINFQLLPPQNSDGPSDAFPCGQYNWEFSISISQGFAIANLVQIPILVRPGDLPCGG